MSNLERCYSNVQQKQNQQNLTKEYDDLSDFENSCDLQSVIDLNFFQSPSTKRCKKQNDMFYNTQNSVIQCLSFSDTKSEKTQNSLLTTRSLNQNNQQNKEMQVIAIENWLISNNKSNKNVLQNFGLISSYSFFVNYIQKIEKKYSEPLINKEQQLKFDCKVIIMARQNKNTEQKRKLIYNIIMKILQIKINKKTKRILKITQFNEQFNKRQIQRVNMIGKKLNKLIYINSQNRLKFSKKKIRYLLQCKQTKDFVNKFLQSQECNEIFDKTNIVKYYQTLRTFKMIMEKSSFEEAISCLENKSKMFSKIPWSFQNFQKAKEIFVNDFMKMKEKNQQLN